MCTHSLIGLFLALLQLRAGTSLGLPYLVTEQYPKALGATVQPVKDALSEGTQIYAKLTFSMHGKTIATHDTVHKQHCHLAFLHQALRPLRGGPQIAMSPRCDLMPRKVVSQDK